MFMFFVPSSYRIVTTSAAAPFPVDACYEAKVTFPFVGAQTVHLRVVSDAKALLSLWGHINLEDEVQYAFHEDGSLHVELGDKTRKMLRRTRSTLKALTYDPSTDVAIVRVAPPIIPQVSLRMHRTV